MYMYSIEVWRICPGIYAQNMLHVSRLIFSHTGMNMMHGYMDMDWCELKYCSCHYCLKTCMQNMQVIYETYYFVYPTKRLCNTDQSDRSDPLNYSTNTGLPTSVPCLSVARFCQDFFQQNMLSLTYTSTCIPCIYMKPEHDKYTNDIFYMFWLDLLLMMIYI